ncbi:MAG: glycosyltransferase family 4 protein [Acidobacteria bacterium]|nr:glycosyltransferase family 4 protein [Acidobacteriota bacterium]
MAEGLRRRGWRVDVHGLQGAFPDADAAAGASLSRVLAGLDDGSRVLIDGLALGGLPEPVVAHRERLRILALVHHPLSDETGLPAAVCQRLRDRERRSLAAVAGVIVTSSFTARGLGRFAVDAARVRVAPPGTDPAPPAAGPAPGEPPQLLSVASVVPRKGHDVLVRALARLRDLSWRCVCAGSLDRAPDHARRVRALAEERGLAGRVRFAGECERAALDRIYAASSLFVLASHYEGYGMVLTEALVRGLPVVSTTGGAIPHTLPGDAALLVPPGDDAALASALGSLLDAEETQTATAAGKAPGPGAARRAGLAAGARRHASALPDWTAAARTFETQLLALAPDSTGSRSRPAAPAHDDGDGTRT